MDYLNMYNTDEVIKRCLGLIYSIEQGILESRIKVLSLSLEKIGYSKEEADLLISEKALKQLEETGRVNCSRLEEECFGYEPSEEEIDDTEKYCENSVYTLSQKERYERIFLSSFDSLEQEMQGAIINTKLNGEEVSEEYIAASNKLVEIIFDEDENLAKLVEKKLFGEREKRKIKSKYNRTYYV